MQYETTEHSNSFNLVGRNLSMYSCDLMLLKLIFYEIHVVGNIWYIINIYLNIILSSIHVFIF